MLAKSGEDELRALANETIPAFSEEALALHYAEQNASTLRYVAKFGRWFVWDSKRWHGRVFCSGQSRAAYAGSAISYRRRKSYRRPQPLIWPPKTPPPHGLKSAALKTVTAGRRPTSCSSHGRYGRKRLAKKSATRKSLSRRLRRAALPISENTAEDGADLRASSCCRGIISTDNHC